MEFLPRWILIPILMAGMVGWAATADGQKKPPAFTVQDEGDFFTPRAKEQANEEIASIKTKFSKDLLIETRKDAPAGFDKVNKKDKEAVNRFFENWSRERAKASRFS